MGSYLSEPITEKVSSDELGDRMKCGSSSMQGWRVSQEDAHNCTIDFDENASLFAVYDGHGGHEVAQYAAQNFPQFLKECESYKKGDYIQALKDAFLGFDATLTTPKVAAILQKIAKGKEEGDVTTTTEDEETVRNLYAEAEMPLMEVMAKYQKDWLNTRYKIREDGKPLLSPAVQSRQNRAHSSGISLAKKVSCGNDSEVSSSSSLDQPGVSKSGEGCSGNGNEVDSTSSNGEPDCSEDVVENEETLELPDSSGDSEKKLAKPLESSNETKLHVNKELNGEVESPETESHDGVNKTDNEDVSSSSIPHENGEVAVSEGKGKQKLPAKSPKLPMRRSPRKISAKLLYRSLFDPDQSDSDSDDADQTFRGVDSSDDDDDDDAADAHGEDGDVEDDVDDEEDGEEEEEEEEEEEGEDEEEEEDLDVDDEEDDPFNSNITEKPGINSGCTAVVALLKGQELYVANAGDSRCVVCRKGQAIEMSLDHKPEDQCESERIVKAGGRITMDGRVNGGLNLSRALGDHMYKRKTKLPAEEQMITALPDVRTLMIDQQEDEFMILACDGIWNCMSSQDVVDFVRPRILKNPEKLSFICEELFDRCLAPDEDYNDGTGCDNMTAVIIQFKPTLTEESRKSTKRATSPDPADNEGSKCAKIESPEGTLV